MSDLTAMDAVAIATLVRERRVSATEVVGAHLARIDRLDGKLRACITVRADEATAEARALDHGDRDRPLAGVPLGVKDQLWTAGTATTCGSRLYGDVATEDATAVARARAAGAIVLAKLNMSELALGGTREPPFGTPRNPWDGERTAGESSGGSGVALAARLVALSLAEDTGGSARTPAAYCGVVGLRPTAGRVSRYGVLPLSPLLDTVAPMARSVRDCARLFDAIAGHDERDPTTSRAVAGSCEDALEEGIGGLRVGVVDELVNADIVHADVRAAVESAVDVLRDLGVRVDRVSVPAAPLAGALFVAIGDVEGAEIHREDLRRRAHEMDAATRTRLAAAALVPAADRDRALRGRALLRRQLASALRSFHVLAGPTSPLLPPRHADVSAPFRVAPEMRARFYGRRSFTAFASLAGLPAISLPCGFGAGGLPIGLHLVGRAFREADVLRVAHAYERATPWHARLPAVD